MFQIICLAGLAGAAVGLVLIVLSYLKDRSLVIPYIIFFACIAVFGAAAFLGIREADKTADDPSAQASDGITSDDPSQEPDSNPSNPAQTDDPPPSFSSEAAIVICDLAQFSKISTNELFNLMGGKGEKDSYGIHLIDSTGLTAHGDIYIFDDAQMEFVVLGDQVIRATYNAPKYYNLNEESINYTQKDDIPLMFGITPDHHAETVEDTPATYRLSPVNDSVADFWVTLMDADAKTFDQVKVTYDSNYLD